MLLAFGEALIELSGDGDGSNALLSEVNHFTPRPGGAVLKQALAAARQGARVRLLTRVGRDAYGGVVRRTLAEAGVEGVVQEDPQLPTSLQLVGADAVAYRMADAQLEAPPESFFEGGTLLHASAWPFGLDPARTTAVKLFREGIRRGLALSLDLNYQPWAFRGDLLEVLRPFLPLSYLKVSEEALNLLDLRPGELFQLAHTVLYFRDKGLKLINLFGEHAFDAPPKGQEDAVYGAFLARIVGGADPEEALKAALEQAAAL